MGKVFGKHMDVEKHSTHRCLLFVVAAMVQHGFQSEPRFQRSPEGDWANPRRRPDLPLHGGPVSNTCCPSAASSPRRYAYRQVSSVGTSSGRRAAWEGSIVHQQERGSGAGVFLRGFLSLVLAGKRLAAPPHPSGVGGPGVGWVNQLAAGLTDLHGLG